MPYKWVDPEVAAYTDNGYVYHSYKHGEWAQPLTFWFTTSPVDEEGYDFDIRGLPDYRTGANVQELLRNAIDGGLLQLPDSVPRI